MKRELIFLPQVSADFIEAFNYYKDLSPRGGPARFEDAFKRSLRQIERGMITHLRVFGHFHRVFLPRFPYNIYYRVVEYKAVITGLLYARADPAKIKGTLEQRVE